MEKPSELEEYLLNQAAQGEVDSQHASFTVAGEAALRKLAAFQLPFAEAWVVKLIQAAVADGCKTPIRVELDRKEAKFCLPLSTIDPTEFESAFYNVEPHSNPAVRHLLTGLWAIGLNQGCPFQVAFSNQESSLIWDGKTLRKVDSKPLDETFVVVGHQFLQPGTAGWVRDSVRASRKNADILTTLSQWCFTCPVPLKVDGRRIDSLQHCPTHGWVEYAFPLTLGFGVGELQPLSIPSGTFLKLSSPYETLASSFNPGDPELKKVGQGSLSSQSSRASAPVPFLVSYFLARVARANKSFLEPGLTESLVYWVRDGVVVDTEPLTKRKSYVAVACFLCAEGLSSDLTTFQLEQSEERQRRIRLARRSIAGELSTMNEHSKHLEKMVQKSRVGTYIGSGIVALAGAGVMWLNPAFGGGLLALAALTLKTGGTSTKTRYDAIMAGIDDLRRHLAQTTD